MSIGPGTLLLFGGIILLMLTGLPVAFVIGGWALLLTYFLWGPQGLYMAAMQGFATASSMALMALPLFVLMGDIMERSGVGGDLYKAMHKLFGGLPGGLAVGTVGMGTIVGAFAGGSMTGTVLMALTGLPEMLKRKYDPKLAIGCIQGAGPLGGIIPPSNIMILYGWVAQISVGQLFMSGVMPGLLLAFLYVVYIVALCTLRPAMGPALPPEERANWKEKLLAVKGVALPVIISVGILVVIFVGVASPSESAAVGVGAAIVSAAIYRQLNWRVLKEAAFRTIGITAMILWIGAGSGAFSTLYNSMGAQEFVKGLITGLDVNRWVVFAIIHVVLLFLGCFLDPTPIIMIALPIMVPVIKQLGFNPIWFGLLFIINMEISYLTPPVGRNLFTMKAMSPPGISMGTIIMAGIPFIIINLIAIGIIVLFPAVALWLPSLMVR